MGGKAFASAAAQGHPTIRTPRMTPAQYEALRSLLKERLQRCFPSTHVGTMIEAPEKDSYGDLDFIIASEEKVDWDALAHRVGATALMPANQGITLAVPIDGQFEELPATKPIRYHSSAAPSSELGVDEYAQVDVTLINPAEFRWWQFYSSYGDLAGILGFIVRKSGFTITDKGLFLRHELLDQTKKINHLQISDKLGWLFLSSDPEQVMLFLGLDPVRWQQGFDKMQDLFSWIAQCRLLTREVLDSSKDNEWGNSKQKQKERKRTIFPNFLFHYCENDADLPYLTNCSEPETEPELRLQERRPYHQDEAIRFFNLRDEFIQHFTLFHRRLVAQQADLILKPLLAAQTDKTGRKLAEVTRGFRRWVAVDDEGKPCISAVRATDDESQLHKLLRPNLDEVQDEEAVAAFVRESWETIKQLERHTA